MGFKKAIYVGLLWASILSEGSVWGMHDTNEPPVHKKRKMSEILPKDTSASSKEIPTGALQEKPEETQQKKADEKKEGEKKEGEKKEPSEGISFQTLGKDLPPELVQLSEIISKKPPLKQSYIAQSDTPCPLYSINFIFLLDASKSSLPLLSVPKNTFWRGQTDISAFRQKILKAAKEHPFSSVAVWFDSSDYPEKKLCLHGDNVQWNMLEENSHWDFLQDDYAFFAQQGVRNVSFCDFSQVAEYKKFRDIFDSKVYSKNFREEFGALFALASSYSHFSVYCSWDLNLPSSSEMFTASTLKYLEDFGFVLGTAFSSYYPSFFDAYDTRFLIFSPNNYGMTLSLLRFGLVVPSYCARYAKLCAEKRFLQDPGLILKAAYKPDGKVESKVERRPWPIERSSDLMYYAYRDALHYYHAFFGNDKEAIEPMDNLRETIRKAFRGEVPFRNKDFKTVWSHKESESHKADMAAFVASTNGLLSLEPLLFYWVQKDLKICGLEEQSNIERKQDAWDQKKKEDYMRSVLPVHYIQGLPPLRRRGYGCGVGAFSNSGNLLVTSQPTLQSHPSTLQEKP